MTTLKLTCFFTIALICSSLAPQVTGATDILVLQTKLLEYRNITQSYPTQEQGLEALVRKPKNHPKGKPWMQLSKGVLNDPWGNPYYYVVGEEFEKAHGVYSTGPDGVSSTLGNDPDDWNSWSDREWHLPERGFDWASLVSYLIAGGFVFVLVLNRMTCTKKHLSTQP